MGLANQGFSSYSNQEAKKKMGVRVGLLNRAVLKEFATLRPAFVKLHAGTQLHV